MSITENIAKRFKYVRSLEEEVTTLQEDRIKLLNHVSKEDAQHFLNRTGWALPDEFGWDPDGHKTYESALELRKEKNAEANDRLCLKLAGIS